MPAPPLPTRHPMAMSMRFASTSRKALGKIAVNDEIVTGPSTQRDTTRTVLPWLLLLFAIGFNLVLLRPELVIRVPPLNDGVLHLQTLEAAFTTLAARQDSTDAWLESITLGYPLSHHYQHLAPVLLALLHLGPAKNMLPLDLFNWSRYLLLSFFPLSIFWSMRRLGFDRLTAASGGLVSSLLATNYLLAFVSAVDLWMGSGLYTQVWGMFLLPPALARHTIFCAAGGVILVSTAAGSNLTGAPGLRLHRLSVAWVVVVAAGLESLSIRAREGENQQTRAGAQKAEI